MIWIAKDMSTFVPPDDLRDAFAESVVLNGTLYRRLSPPMFRALREDREAKKEYPGRYAELVGCIFELGLEKKYSLN